QPLASPDEGRKNDLRRDQLAPGSFRRQEQQARNRQRRHGTKASRRKTATAARVVTTVGDGVAPDVQRDRFPGFDYRSRRIYQTLQPGRRADRRRRSGRDTREKGWRARRTR